MERHRAPPKLKNTFPEHNLRSLPTPGCRSDYARDVTTHTHPRALVTSAIDRGISPTNRRHPARVLAAADQKRPPAQHSVPKLGDRTGVNNKRRPPGVGGRVDSGISQPLPVKLDMIVAKLSSSRCRPRRFRHISQDLAGWADLETWLPGDDHSRQKDKMRGRMTGSRESEAKLALVITWLG